MADPITVTPTGKLLDMMRGEDRIERFTARDATGTPFDLSTYDLWWSVRVLPGSGDEIIHKKFVGGVPTGITLADQGTNPGEFLVTINAADTADPAILPTGSGYYDVWIGDTNGKRKPLLKPGPFNIGLACTTDFA